MSKMFHQMKKTVNYLKVEEKAESTIQTYQIHLRHFYSYLKHIEKDYTEVKPKDIRKYIQESKKQEYGNSTLNIKLSAIKYFYNRAIEDEQIQYNPVLQTLKLKNDSLKTDPLTEREKGLILGYLEEKEEHIRLAFRVLFFTGLRVSELTALQKKDIKIINGRVTVEVTKGKRENNRIVPIFDEKTSVELLEYQKTAENPFFKVGTRTIQYHARQISRKLGIGFTVHQTRHTFATDRLKENIRLDILQKLMGHKDISTTMLYAKTLDIDIIESAPAIQF